MKKKVIYLDSHASTPVDQDVLDEMIPFFTQNYGNGNHKAGWKSAAAMEVARNQVSDLIGARPSEIIFTSGATEAINLALLGLASANNTNRKHIVTQRTEHSAVLECIDSLKEKGYRITILDVDAVGRIDLNELQDVVDNETLVVAVMLVNNEVGTVQPIGEIGKICRASGAKYFCDLTQGIGWHPVDVDKMNIDLAAMSAHKIYGPRGVGALFLRRHDPKVILNPILFGGGQERSIRPGTANIPAIVGFGKACELYFSNSEKISKKLRMLRDRLQDHIFTSIEGIRLNGCPDNRHPGNLNIAIPGITGEDLIGALPNIIFSTSSACASGSTKPSHVISALGVNKEVLKGAFRFGINKFNTTDEIDYVGDKIIETAKHLQKKRMVDLFI
jgi:cysteine desulfurase